MTIQFIGVLLIILVSGSLQGCFPVIAAGVGTGALIAQDRRDSTTFVVDEKIEFAASDRIGKQIKLRTHINITSFNRKVLISGEVPDESTKEEVGKIISDIENVLGVYNELVVSENSSLASRSNDSLITADVKIRFMRDKRFDAPKFNTNSVKVVTENGTVFLAGIVSRAEAEAATDIASTTAGVKRVVKLFEYID